MLRRFLIILAIVAAPYIYGSGSNDGVDNKHFASAFANFANSSGLTAALNNAVFNAKNAGTANPDTMKDSSAAAAAPSSSSSSSGAGWFERLKANAERLKKEKESKDRAATAAAANFKVHSGMSMADQIKAATEQGKKDREAKMRAFVGSSSSNSSSTQSSSSSQAAPSSSSSSSGGGWREKIKAMSDKASAERLKKEKEAVDQAAAFKAKFNAGMSMADQIKVATEQGKKDREAKLKASAAASMSASSSSGGSWWSDFTDPKKIEEAKKKQAAYAKVYADEKKREADRLAADKRTDAEKRAAWEDLKKKQKEKNDLRHETKKIFDELEQMEQPNPDQILEDFEREKAQDELIRDDKLDEAFKKQNTVIWEKKLLEFDESEFSFPVGEKYNTTTWRRETVWSTIKTPKSSLSIGLYKRDLIEGPVFIANLAADYFLYKKLKQERLNRIFENIKNNNEEFEQVFTTTIYALSGYGDAYLSSGFFARLFTNYFSQVNEIYKPLNDYYNKHFTSASLNPFNSGSLLRKQVLVPLLLRLGLERFSEYFEEKSLKRLKWDYVGLPMIWEDAQSVDKKGVYTSRGGTFSILNIAKFLLAGRSWTRLFWTNPYQGPPLLYYLNKYKKLGIPDWFFNERSQKIGHFASQVVSMCLAANYLDNFYQARWTDYMAKNSAELIDLLTKYRKAKENVKNGVADAEKIKISIENQIKSFIEKGHELNSRWPTAGINEWLLFKAYGYGSASYYASLPVTLPITLYAGWKIYKWGSDLFGTRIDVGQSI